MFCMKCGQEVPPAAEFCPKCGQSTKQPVAPAPAYTAPAPPPPVNYAAAPYVAAPARLQGVGGGLIFFCIAFTILWPLWTLIQYAMTNFAVLRHFTALGLLGPVRMVFGIVVGIVLWTGKPAAMVLLRIYFVLAGVLTLWGIYNWVRFMSHFQGYMVPSIIRNLVLGLGPSIVFLVAGVLYFSMSERVRATYGSKLF